MRIYLVAGAQLRGTLKLRTVDKRPVPAAKILERDFSVVFGGETAVPPTDRVAADPQVATVVASHDTRLGEADRLAGVLADEDLQNDLHVAMHLSFVLSVSAFRGGHHTGLREETSASGSQRCLTCWRQNS